jgi:tRNA modification GTPase
MTEKPTIFALSSGRGRAAVAVVRVSGPDASRVIETMAAPVPRKRMAVLRKLRHPVTRSIIDEALVFWSAAPKSETGEDVAELQVHGGPGVVRAVLEALSQVPGCRLAEPGEFTRRALENGRVGLLEVEGLADLIDAETEAQRRQALTQMSGASSALYDGWRTKLLNAAALVEAAIDFSDEGDVSADALALSRRVIEELADEVARHADDGRRGELVRDGWRVALVGPPNAGKSSLLNALARRDVAIVADEAGTTRDVVEIRLDLAGYPVVVADTAGIREAGSAVEGEGIRRSLKTAGEADLVLWLVDAAAPKPELPPELDAVRDRTLKVLNKIDLMDPQQEASLHQDLACDLAVSARTSDGIGALVDRLTATIAAHAGGAAGTSGDPVISSARHRALVDDCLAGLKAFLAGDARQSELRAEDLRRAAAALGRITGRIDAEDVLDQVFSRFCIGK